MNIPIELYKESTQRLPKSGQHILANQTDGDLIVYQAYRPSIATFAVTNQRLGGPDYSYNRMSRIKPNFLWMMYRCGWAEKENQQRVLAIRIGKETFDEVLQQAVFSSFNPQYYSSHDEWKAELESKEVRLQWDPDHDPYGHKLERRAIQLGMKGNALKSFIQQIKAVEDMTDFVHEQKRLLDTEGLDSLFVPVETGYRTNDDQLNKRIGL